MLSVDQGVLFLQLKRGEWAFNDFLRNGLVEYLDVNEENNALIALYERNCGAADNPSLPVTCIAHAMYMHASAEWSLCRVSVQTEPEKSQPCRPSNNAP